MKNLIQVFISCLIFLSLGCDKDEENHSHNENEIITHTIFAGNFYYDPPNITINQGEEIRWINDGGLHDVNAEINSLTNTPFNNPELFNSASTSVVGAEIYRHIFNMPGFYNYDCSVGGHALNGMVGTITVLPLK